MYKSFAAKHRLPGFRMNQLKAALFDEFITSYDGLTTWPKPLRELIRKEIPFATITPLTNIVSKDKGTEKVLFERISDKQVFEAVLMRHKDGRNTVCVSCMIGCPVGCVFCATGKMGFISNLSAREIVDQVLYFARRLHAENQHVTNVVYMGMGEPLINLLPVMESVRTLSDPEQLGLGTRRITISTSGITPALRTLISSGYKGRLALSLHAPTQKQREQIMPVAKRFPLDELVAVLKNHAERTQLRISFEYILIDGVNDRPEDARTLARLLGKHLVHVNLIPYNPVAGQSLRRSTPRNISAFAAILAELGTPYTIRVTMGDDIKAACGQLATKNLPKKQV